MTARRESAKVRQIVLSIDVRDAARLGESAHLAVTVSLPEPNLLRGSPVVCFAKPGGGYSRKYFTSDLPGPGAGAQADWHVARGWIFVSIDLLGAGESSHHASEKLGYTPVVAASLAAEKEVLLRLANGTLAADFPPVREPLTLGMGQSLGGCLTIVQQGRYHCYDGIAVLGFSAVHTHPPSPPGDAPIVAPWVPRDCLNERPLIVLNEGSVTSALTRGARGSLWRALAWSFHYDDVPREVVELDLGHFDRELPSGAATGTPPPWSSLTQPDPIAQSCLTPGVVAPEAAAITVPVLSAMGERDVIADPAGEARAYRSTRSFDLFICPNMGHMHNFAGTRELLWQRIEQFAAWCAVMKVRTSDSPPS